MRAAVDDANLGEPLTLHTAQRPRQGKTCDSCHALMQRQARGRKVAEGPTWQLPDW
jgi:hypothetical protein